MARNRSGTSFSTVDPSSSCLAIAEELLGLGIDERDAPVAVDDDDGVRCGLEEAAELVLRLLAVGDVPDGARDQDSLFGLEGTETDLDRELRAVLPTPV